MVEYCYEHDWGNMRTKIISLCNKPWREAGVGTVYFTGLPTMGSPCNTRDEVGEGIVPTLASTLQHLVHLP